MTSVLRKGKLLSVSFYLCWMFVQSSPLQCNFPPSVWCSSRLIARACQVEEQCEYNAWRIQSNAPKVNLSVYYETLCPDSIRFIDTQLWPAFQNVANIFNLELVPYGKANETRIGGIWKFSCQHGPFECVGNLIQTCAIHIIGNVSKVLPFVHCMEMSDLRPGDSAPGCAEKHGIDYEPVKRCATGLLGNGLEHEMALKTGRLIPRLTFVPWITLNGMHTDEIQQEALTDLMKLLCDTYTGQKPDFCRCLMLHKCQKDDV